MEEAPETRENGTGMQDARYRDRYLILAIVLASGFLGVVDIQIVAIALPTITHLLNVPVGQTQWIATSYVVTVLATVLMFGTISHGIGRRRILQAGLVIFTAGSLACGLSTTISELILFRLIQGLGASLMMSVLVAIIVEVFPPEERGRAMGLNTAMIALGLIAGPSAGGFIIDAAGWPSIFFVNVPLGILLIAGSIRYLGRDPPEPGFRFTDYAGAVLLVVLMGSLALALNTLANPPIPFIACAFWTAAAAAALVLFVRRERSVQQPLLDIGIFRNSAFVLPATSLILYLTATFILLTGQPFYFQGVMGLSPSHIGIIALITPVTMILCAPLFGWMYDHLPWKGYTAAGLVLMGCAYIWCGYAFARTDFLLIVAAFVLTGIARSIFQGPNVIEIMAALPSRLHGAGSGLITTLMYLGIILGISLTTIFLTAGLTVRGYSGQVLLADPALLAPVFGFIMVAGGLICFAGAACSYHR